MMAENNGPKITVYIISHAYGEYVEQAILSVLQQTYKNYELLLIDNGSTDNTSKVYKHYEKMPIVRTFKFDNLALPKVCQMALEHAKGQYILRLDGDDFLDPNALLTLLVNLEENELAALAHPNYYVTDKTGEVLYLQRNSVNYEDVFQPIAPPHGACCLIDVKLLRSLGGYNTLVEAQDGLDAWLKLKSKFEIVSVETPLFYYRQHQNNLSAKQQKITKARRSHKERSQKTMAAPNLGVIICRSNFDFELDCWSLKLGTSSLLELSIEKAINCGFDRIIVACDNPNVEEIVKAKHDPSIFFHQREISETVSTVSPAITLRKIVAKYDEDRTGLVTVLHPQAALVSAATINELSSTLLSFDCDSVMFAQEEHGLLFSRGEFGLTPINNFRRSGIRSEKDVVFSDVGLGYCAKSSNIATGTIFGPRHLGIAAPDDEKLFISSYLELETAQIILEQKG